MDHKLDTILKIEKSISEHLDARNYTRAMDYMTLSYYLSCYCAEEFSENYYDTLYFKKALSALEQFKEHVNFNAMPIGCWYGYTGLGYIVHALSIDDINAGFLNKINDFIAYQVLKFIHEYDWRTRGSLASTYDILNGISGIGKYFMECGAKADVVEAIAKELVEYCLFTAKEAKTLGGVLLYGENITNFELKKDYYNGYIDMGISHGILGPLVFYAKLKTKALKSGI